MKIEVKDITNHKNLVGHLVLNACTSHVDLTTEIRDAGYADIRMTVNDKEVDVNGFVDHWQSQVRRMISEEARELLDAKFITTEYILTDLNTRLLQEVNKNLDEWEEEQTTDDY